MGYMGEMYRGRLISKYGDISKLTILECDLPGVSAHSMMEPAPTHMALGVWNRGEK